MQHGKRHTGNIHAIAIHEPTIRFTWFCGRHPELNRPDRQPVRSGPCRLRAALQRPHQVHRAQFCGTTDMIDMTVCDQDALDGDLFMFQHLQDLFHVPARIDNDAFSRFFILK